MPPKHVIGTFGMEYEWRLNTALYFRHGTQMPLKHGIGIFATERDDV